MTEELKEHDVVYILGLRDQRFGKHTARFLRPFWDRRRFPLHVIAPDWHNGHFYPKFQLILHKVDELLKQGKRVSIIGQSAGGSAALSAFQSRKEYVTAGINVTGRLRQGLNVGRRHVQTLDYASRNSPAFREFVLLFERDFESRLTYEERRRIMTVRPRWDQIVSPDAVHLEGATNLVSPFPEHTLGGLYIMTAYSRVLQDFIRVHETPDYTRGV